MLATFLGLCVVSVGVDIGWKPYADGGVLFLIQINPATLDSLARGQAIESGIPPMLAGEVRGYRITVGNERLERQDPPPKKPEPAVVRPPAQPPAATPQTPAPPFSTLPKLSSSELWPERRPPQSFAPDPAGRPLVEPSGALVDERKPAPAAAAPPAAATPTVEPSPRWWPLTLVAMALAGSLSWNAYLLWALYEARVRFRRLIGRVASVNRGEDDAGAPSSDYRRR